MTDPGAPFSRRELREQQPPSAGPSRRRPVIIGVAVGAAFLLLCVGALFAGAAVGSSRPSAAASSNAPDNTAPVARAVPDPLPPAEALRTCSVDANARDERLGTFAGYVSDLSTGSTLFTRSGDKGTVAPGALQLLTASLAIKLLGPDRTLDTKVYRSTADPGTIVLVGAGDPTLSALPAGTESVYPGAPRLDDLATQVEATLAGAPITQIVVDSTLWPESDAWSGGWARTLVGGGRLSEVTALQVDGDRADPTELVSPRSGHPVQNAGTAFEKALGLSGVPIVEGRVAEGDTEIASVASQKISSLVTTMLQLDDATLAEHLARVISVVAGGDGTLADYQKYVATGVTSLGLDPAGVTVWDGSGISTKNSVPPHFIASLLGLLSKGQDGLNVVYSALAVAGSSGSLAERFTTGSTAAAAGHVVAQAGDGSLAGVVTAGDGTSLAFSFVTVKVKGAGDVDAALDTLTAAVYTCGANLSNH